MSYLATRSNLPVVLFVAMLWARVSDIGITDFGLPSLALPFALALVGVSIWRRLAASERVDVGTFRGLLPFLPYLGVVSLSALWATETQRSLDAAINLAKDLIILWVLVELIVNVDALARCCMAVVLAAGALSALSVYQQLTGTFGSNYAGFAQASIRQIVARVDLYRLAGPVGDPNYYALILLVTVPLGLALLRTPARPLTRFAVLGAVVLSSGTVLLTYSRGGAVVLGMSVVLSLLRVRARVPLVAALLCLPPLAMLLLPTPVWERAATVLYPVQDTGHVGQLIDDSVELRLGAQRVAVEQFLDHPFGGVGAGNYPLLYQDYSRALGVAAVATEFYPHNLYLQVGAETGSLGLLTFLPAAFGPLLGLELTRRSAKRFASDAHREWIELAAGVSIALASYLAASLLLHASYPRYMWILVALAVAARKVATVPPARM